jgi:hypothetical protein
MIPASEPGAASDGDIAHPPDVGHERRRMIPKENRMHLTKRTLIIACLAILTIAAAGFLTPVIYFSYFIIYFTFRDVFFSAPNVSERQLELAVKKLKQRGYKPGLYHDVLLPPSLRSLTEMGKVDVFRTKDGRTIVLFKTFLRAKGNYRGVLYSDAPFKPGDEGVDPFGRTAIMLDGFPATIETRVNPRYFVVFNDYG